MAAAPPAPSADSAGADVAVADAVPDGVRLAGLTEALPLSRNSMFELVKALGIVTVKGPGPGGKGRVAWLSSTDAARLRKAAMDVAAGRLRIADVGALAQSQPTPPTLRTLPEAPSADSADRADLASLLQRIQAAEAAARAGFPLSTAELTAILGARPGGPVVTRAGIVARRLARNVWRIETVAAPSADPADSGDTARRTVSRPR